MYPPPERQCPVPNKVLLQHRLDRGWGRGRAALELIRVGQQLGLPVSEASSVEQAIKRHEKGLVRVADEMYMALYSAAYGVPPHELFGDFYTPGIASAQDCFTVQSHKFVPVYIGPAAVAELRSTLGAVDRETSWAACWTAPVEHEHGRCTLYGFPWGSIVYHLEEEQTTSHIADIAVWRHHTYHRELAWVASHVTGLLPTTTGKPEYVLSAFWMDSPKWEGAQLETAMRLLCTPRCLIDGKVNEGSRDRGRLIEQAFLRDGYDDQRIVNFGNYGVSLGYASWAGVTYYPVATRTALHVSKLIDLELLVQGLWCLCQHIRAQVETGQDPHVEPEYGWRWLRGIRSKMTSARPQETAQEASMRVAVLETSELDRHLSQALEYLRDVEREGNR